MDHTKEWKKPELIIISGIETSENVLEWNSGPPKGNPQKDGNPQG